MLKWLNELIFGHRFEFQSPHTVEHCVELLLAVSKRDGKRLELFGLAIRGNPQNKLLVTVEPLGDDTYRFRMHRDAGRNLHAEVLGVLKQHDTHTFVSGRGRIGIFSLGFTVFWLVVWAIIWLTIGIPEIALFGIGVVTFLNVIAGLERERLARMPKRLLTSKF